MKGIIFDIKEFSVHDGPGGRFTVFMKGCPLRCLWCHNPEGLYSSPQLMHKKNLCTKCGRCKVKCEHIECREYDRCIHACANGCLSVSGKEMTTDALADYILKNADFLKMTGGGVTVSGGEPLMQGEFVYELTKKLPDVHKTIQTSGYADFEVYKKVVNEFDYIMQDIKIIDRELHKKYTGVCNDRILRNIEYLKQSGKKFVFRVPLIPDITDVEENLKKISEIAGEYPVELLPYNTMAGVKYKMLGMDYSLDEKGNRQYDFTKYFVNAAIR